MRPIRRWQTVLAAASLVVVGCANATVPTAGQPGVDDPANGPVPPPGEAVRFEEATLSEDQGSLTLAFTGGKEYDPADPCSHHYFGWAHESDGTLESKIVDDTPRAPGAPVACNDMGYGRTVTIDLAARFLGVKVRDLAGYIHFVGPPEGLAKLRVPPRWTLAAESDVGESPTGRWQRTWTMGEPPALGTSKGKIDLYQAFDGPANVTGGEEVRSVQVNGTAATLYRFAPDGELVLVWKLGDDGLALVVNETDFSADEAILLAESATVP